MTKKRVSPMAASVIPPPLPKERQCLQAKGQMKAVYVTRSQAHRAIRRIHGCSGVSLTSYRCPTCDAYHLTKVKKY